MANAKQIRRWRTQHQQAAAEGHSLHPRHLARSIAKTLGAGKNWRKAVASLPKRGRKYLHPERHTAAARAALAGKEVET